MNELQTVVTGKHMDKNLRIRKNNAILDTSLGLPLEYLNAKGKVMGCIRTPRCRQGLTTECSGKQQQLLGKSSP